MAKEIERKFLLNELPAELVQGVQPVFIKQGYVIAEKNRELRVRSKGENYFLTSKHGDGLVREENEQIINSDQFNLLWAFTENRRIEKSRYTIGRNELVFEVDQYEGSLEGLKILEIEFDSIEAAKQFVVPSYCVEDLTSDRRYKNVMLATKGRPK